MASLREVVLVDELLKMLEHLLQVLLALREYSSALGICLSKVSLFAISFLHQKQAEAPITLSRVSP